MKIAMVVTGGLHPSGTEQVVPSWLALFERLATKHEVHAFVLRHLAVKQTYSLRGFTVHDLGRPSAPFGLTRIFQRHALVNAMHHAGPFDLVHAFWADPAGALAVHYAWPRRLPRIVTCDSGEFASIPSIDYGSQRTDRGRSAVSSACGYATRVHVCSQFMASLAAQHGVKTTIIPLVSEGAAIGRPEPAAARQQSPFTILQVASLSRVKNQRMLIDALALVRQRIDARLDLVGEDTLGGELQRHASEKGLADRVTFHGFLPQRALPARFAAADLYAQSSLHEAAGVSVLEAAAAGVPIAGTRVGHVADWDGARATAIAEPDPVMMADAILRLHDDPVRRRALADAAAQWAREHDADAVAARFEALYQTVLVSGRFSEQTHR
jgi:glycosyltransferase involved in cell wall biosynthesis